MYRRPKAPCSGLRDTTRTRVRIDLDLVTVAQPPCEYESRLPEMFPGAFIHLRLLALGPYDLALTKLERNIERDRKDVRYLARTVPFDIDLLRERNQTEHRPYLGNPKREDLTIELWIEAIAEDRASSRQSGKVNSVQSSNPLSNPRSISALRFIRYLAILTRLSEFL